MGAGQSGRRYKGGPKQGRVGFLYLAGGHYEKGLL
jgi:hypothetical protein